MGPLYQVQNPINTALQGMGSAASTYGSMDKTRSAPNPTIGGGMMAGAGGAIAGAELAKLLGYSSGGSFAGIGAGFGMLSYFLS